MTEPFETLHQEFIGRSSTIGEIHQRNQDIQAKEADFHKRRQAVEATGAKLPPVWEEEEYQRLQAERISGREALNQHLHKPTLQKETISELRSRLSPEQRAQLRLEMLQSLSSTPAEIQTAVAQTMEDAVQKVLAESGRTPGAEGMLARVKTIREHLHQRNSDDEEESR